jgi:hypothetical protein
VKAFLRKVKAVKGGFSMRRPRSGGDKDEEGGFKHDGLTDEELCVLLQKNQPAVIFNCLSMSRDPASFAQRQPVRDLLNVCDDGDNTVLPLWQAVVREPHLVRPLLEAGADPWLYDALGKPLLWCIHYREYHDFFKNGNVRSRQMFGWRANHSEDGISAIIQEAMRRWTPDTHLRFPEEFQQQVFSLLLINRRNPPRVRMPKDVLHIIIRDVAAHAATWHRDRVDEAEFENHTNWHLICMTHERGFPRMSSRSIRQTIINKLLRHAAEHGPE